MNKSEKRARIAAVNVALKELYPDECALLWGGDDPWRLLVMARLSAQCTDARVNIAAGPLFERFPDAKAMAAAKAAEVEPYVKSCGLYHRKNAEYRIKNKESLQWQDIPDQEINYSVTTE